VERKMSWSSVSPYHREGEDEKSNRIELRHTVFLHDTEELDNDLRAGSDEDLPLASLLGVVDGVERIIEDGCFDHRGG
jgi:hypothetical protein